MIWTQLGEGVQGTAVHFNAGPGRGAGKGDDATAGQVGASTTASAGGTLHVTVLQHEPHQH